MTIIVAETDEAAYAKRDELLSYGDKEGALALFGVWTGFDLRYPHILTTKTSVSGAFLRFSRSSTVGPARFQELTI